MPSKFSRYWESIDTPSSTSPKQHAKLKQMIRHAFHSGIHVEAKTNRVPELMDSLTLRDKNIEELESKIAIHEASIQGRIDCFAELKTAEAQLEAVRPYIRHKPDCNKMAVDREYEAHCDCGLRLILEKES